MGPLDVKPQRASGREAELAKRCLDRAPFLFYRGNRQGGLLAGNQTACESLGYTSAELLERTVFDFDPMMTRDRWDALWQNMLENRFTTYETIHRRSDASVFPVVVTIELIEFDNQPMAIIYANKIVEGRLRQAQRMESLGTLATGVAHDFNNILSAIYEYAELAQLRCSSNKKLRNYIDQICTASIRAKNLIKQIQTFSRQGASKKRNLDISFAILETLKLIRATLPSTIQMKQAVQSGLGDVFADETHIHQIVMNLCTNAYHAMQANGGLLEVNLERVTIGAYDSQAYPVISPGKYLKLTVSDTGTGIPPGDLSRIFEPYFSTKSSGEGTGMGLSTVIGIVEDHNGSIKVDSFQGVGSVFQIFLPLVETTGKRPLEEPKAASILLVDDEPPLLLAGKEYLEDMGYVVETMDSPIDAINAIESNPERFDLIITDLTMPQMTGEMLAGEIKKVLPQIPIIMCTGFDSDSDARRLKALGIDRLLSKPLNLIELGEAIRKLTGYPAN